MKNEKNVTIQDLENYYQAVIWHSCDKITNLSDETVGYYAYRLQEILFREYAYGINESLKDDSVLINKTLEKIVYPLEELSISHEEIKTDTVITFHQFELFFRITHNGAGMPVVLRNGYLLKCLKDAGIKTFKELDEYEAVLIYNKADVNPHICSFVNFKKK